MNSDEPTESSEIAGNSPAPKRSPVQILVMILIAVVAIVLALSYLLRNPPHHALPPASQPVAAR